MEKNCMRIGDKDYIRVKDKLIEIDHYDENGKPVIKSISEEIKHSDGRVDVVVHVQCLQIQSKKE